MDDFASEFFSIMKKINRNSDEGNKSNPAARVSVSEYSEGELQEELEIPTKSKKSKGKAGCKSPSKQKRKNPQVKDGGSGQGPSNPTVIVTSPRCRISSPLKPSPKSPKKSNVTRQTRHPIPIEPRSTVTYETDIKGKGDESVEPNISGCCSSEFENGNIVELVEETRNEVEVTAEEDVNDTSQDSAGDEDIYGDLESSIFISRSKNSGYNQESEERLKKLLKDYETLKRELKKVEKENKAYASNISSLYLTAKNEIEKKNFIIKQLQEKLKAITLSRTQQSSMSKIEIEEILRNCQEAYQEAHSQVILREIRQTIDQMKAAKVSGKKKQYRFGNMSLYFHREESSFQRTSTVTFPDAKKSTIEKGCISNKKHEPTRLEPSTSESLNSCKYIPQQSRAELNSTEVAAESASRKSLFVHESERRRRNDEMTYRPPKSLSTENNDGTVKPSLSSKRRKSGTQESKSASHSPKERSPIPRRDSEKVNEKSSVECERSEKSPRYPKQGASSKERQHYSNTGSPKRSEKIESRNYKSRDESPSKGRYNGRKKLAEPSPSKSRKRKYENDTDRDTVTSRLRSSEGSRNRLSDVSSRRYRNNRSDIR